MEEEADLYNSLRKSCKYLSLVEQNKRLVARCSEEHGTNSSCSFLFLRENEACIATEFYQDNSTTQTRLNPDKIDGCPYRKR